MWFICPHYIITSKHFAQPHNTSQFYTATLHDTSKLFKVMILFMTFVDMKVYVYAPEVASLGVYNMRAPQHASKTLLGCTQCNSSRHSCQSGFSHDQT